MPTLKQKYQRIKKDPALGLFQSVQEMEKQISDLIKQAVLELKEKIAEEVEKKTKQIDPTMETMVRNILKGIKGEKGEIGVVGPQGVKGDKGDSIRGEQGPQGLPGVSGAMGERGLSGKDGKNGYDGKTPVLGIDYFTKQEKENMTNDILERIKLKPILDELKKIKDEIANLKRAGQFGARTIHRGGIDFQDPALLGTGDGATLTFTLPSTPYSSTSLIQLSVGGGSEFETDDWTRSDKTITFLTAPELGAKIRSPQYRKA